MKYFMNLFLLIILLLTCCENVYSQNTSVNLGTKYNNKYKWKDYTSLGIYGTGFLLDYSSSLNHLERKSHFQDSNGYFSPRKYSSFHIPIIASTILLDHFVLKDENKKYRWVTFAFRTTLGIVLIRAGIKNFNTH